MSSQAPPLAAAAPPGAEARRRRSRGGVGAFLLRRTAAGIATLLVVTIVTFLALNVLPGNVASVVLGKNATPDQVHLLEQKLGLGRSVPARYLDWLGGVLHGDLGASSIAAAQGLPDASLWPQIQDPLKNTVILAALTILLLTPLSLVIGVLAARYEDRAPDHAISVLTLIFISLPEFVVGSLLVIAFFSWLHLLPPVVLVPPGGNPLESPKALILPIATLALTSLAWTARLVRVGMVEVLRSDWVRSSRLNGHPERRLVWRDGLRNGLAPSIQVFALTTQYLVGGVIVTEAVFSYPGVGTYLVHAVLVRDVTAVQSITLIVAGAYILINILADLMVVMLVPRLRTAL